MNHKNFCTTAGVGVYDLYKSEGEISKLFDEKGVLSYLDENAEILHTQGKNHIFGETDEF